MPITEDTPQKNTPLEPNANWFSPKCVEAQQLTGHLGVNNCFGAGRESGRSGKEFVEACKKATGVEIKVDFLPSDPTKILGDLNWTARFTNLQDSLQIHPSSWLCFLLKTEETTTN
ncbi:unnamed protein product [Brassica rapa]|uniref:Uncharacterized protein n=2 Tax=Brassica TaxID=3705 RepID=A0A3P6AS96_BRACM|nr:unnamed protein product [Brassica napus]CAG7894618.1 unnamed protein product [Brassica rapa]CDY14928.1 BnaA02g22700D [Brassica napus]VDC90553.1 unnamed protein product [Brassica rapa]